MCFWLSESHRIQTTPVCQARSILIEINIYLKIIWQSRFFKHLFLVYSGFHELTSELQSLCFWIGSSSMCSLFEKGFHSEDGGEFESSRAPAEITFDSQFDFAGWYSGLLENAIHEIEFAFNHYFFLFKNFTRFWGFWWNELPYIWQKVMSSEKLESIEVESWIRLGLSIHWIFFNPLL